MYSKRSSLHKLFILAVCAFTQSGSSVQAQTTSLLNSGLENPYQAVRVGPNMKAQLSGEIAEGWRDDSAWADVTVNYARDTETVHGGTASQRIEAKEIRGGAVQFVQPVTLVKGHSYRATFWLKAASGTSISIALRQAGIPYKTYASKEIGVSPEWQPFSFVTMASEDGPAYLMLNIKSACTLWLDDAKFEDLQQVANDAPPRIGNMLPNGSFEAGLGNGWRSLIRGYSPSPLIAQADWQDVRPQTDETTASDDQKSMRLTIPRGMTAILTSPKTPFTFNRAHSASIALKAERPINAQIGVQTVVGTQSTTLNKDIKIGTEWQRFEYSGVMPYATDVRLIFICTTNEPITIWWDAAQLEEKATPSAQYQAAFPVELGLRVPRPSGIVFDGEVAPVEISLGGKLPVGARMQWRVEDVAGRSLDLPDVKLPAKEFPLAPMAQEPRGLFKLRGGVFDAKGKAISAEVETIFARLPQPRNIAPERSFFGVHIPLNPESIAMAKAIGAHWVRIHDASSVTKWPTIEWMKGQFQFEDQGVKAARAAGLQVLGMLDGAPPWASLKPQATSGYFASYNVPDAPDGPQKWAEYVSKTVSHYKGTIDYWEVWNEPWGSIFLNAPPETYGALLKSAYQSAKAANPEATVMGVNTVTNRDEWTQRVLDVAGPENFDKFTYHDYGGTSSGGPQSGPAKAALKFRDFQAKVGTPKPLWNTEGGPGVLRSWYGTETDGLSLRDQLSAQTRFDVTQMGAGVEKFIYYTLHAPAAAGDISLSALEYDRTPRPVLIARAVLASLVDGAKCLGRTEPVAGVDAYDFKQDEGGRVTVLWSYDGSKHEKAVPANVDVLDVSGNPLSGAHIQLTAEPIYFVYR